MNVFVSTSAAQSPPASDLIGQLRATGHVVQHSPVDGDAAWDDWYEVGLTRSIAWAGAAIVVVDCGWDSSTWMGIESDEIRTRLDAGNFQAFLWNPEGIAVRAAGMIPYVQAFRVATLNEIIDGLR